MLIGRLFCGFKMTDSGMRTGYSSHRNFYSYTTFAQYTLSPGATSKKCLIKASFQVTNAMLSGWAGLQRAGFKL